MLGEWASVKMELAEKARKTSSVDNRLDAG
jgi:hypothetical protein